MKDIYGDSFYKDRHQNTVYSARTILSIVLDAIPTVHSAIDFGCGVGTWLSVLKEKGANEIQGLDGPWVEREFLQIPKQDFREVNFEKPITLDKKYDLAVTLEVAEHISDNSADDFVDSLTTASDFVLFSAAIPFQGGSGHVNEQWPDYWAEMFSKREYIALDFVRRDIWDDKQIPTSYKQNILLFLKKDQLPRVKASRLDINDNNAPISLVHPDSYLSKVNSMQSVKGSWKLFRRALKSYVREKVGETS